MKNIFLYSLILSISLTIFNSCGTMKNKDITGEKEIKSAFNMKKYEDNDDIFYVEAVGEHGYESEARQQNFEDARLQFNLKAGAMVETAAKRDGTNSLRNRVGTMDIETKRTVVTRAAQSYMKEAEGKMSYSESRNVYIYRSVYTIEIDYIIQLLKAE
jgi:hypothetical protein